MSKREEVNEEQRRRRRIERARKGGEAVKAKYGLEYYSRIGRLGGRPTWQEELAKARARDVRTRKGARAID